MVAYARATTAACLTPEQRKSFFLAPEPPRWCITGAGRETAPPDEWEGKWPYQSEAWRQWLIDRDAGKDVPMPGEQVQTAAAPPAH
jgi:hypothetical protein